MTRDELCAWTLDQLGNAEAFADEEEMMINRKLVYMVIQRMLNNVNIKSLFYVHYPDPYAS